MTKKIRSLGRGALLAAAVFLSASPLWAQSDPVLPVPFESYGEDDPAAVAPKRVDSSDSRGLKVLEQVLQYDPENVSARVQNAELMIARGMRQRGLDEYLYALRLAQADEKKRRMVHWNYGWALFNGGEARGAVSQWMQAEALHGGRPQWVPTTYAIGLWEAQERELAIKFYKSAVRSFPRRWGEAGGLEEATRNWNPNQKLAIKAVYAAWRASLGSPR